MEYGYTQTEDSFSVDAPEITRAESRLAEAVGSVISNLEILEKRLERVLRPSPPAEVNTENKSLAEVRPETTQLTDYLNAQASRLESTSERVCDVLRRLGL